jgi:hypothetical protein
VLRAGRDRPLVIFLLAKLCPILQRVHKLKPGDAASGTLESGQEVAKTSHICCSLQGEFYVHNSLGLKELHPAGLEPATL